MLGIDKVKELAAYIVNNVAEPLQNYLADGEFSFMEIIQFLYKQLPVVNIYNSRDEILDQIKDMDNDEVEELINFIASEYNYTSEKAKKIVEAFRVWLNATNDLVQAFKS